VNQLRRQFPVWGTIVDVDCSSASVSVAALDAAMGSVITFCENIDRDFSTYKEGSWISRLRRGEVVIEDCPEDVPWVCMVNDSGTCWCVCIDCQTDCILFIVVG
jgi:thiamine biosynthesis lipoprotein